MASKHLGWGWEGGGEGQAGRGRCACDWHRLQSLHRLRTVLLWWAMRLACFLMVGRGAGCGRGGHRRKGGRGQGTA
eukprot:1160890-Pelagomonas_calceolata.AAC.13